MAKRPAIHSPLARLTTLAAAATTPRLPSPLPITTTTTTSPCDPPLQREMGWLSASTAPRLPYAVWLPFPPTRDVGRLCNLPRPRIPTDGRPATSDQQARRPASRNGASEEASVDAGMQGERVGASLVPAVVLAATPRLPLPPPNHHQHILLLADVVWPSLGPPIPRWRDGLGMVWLSYQRGSQPAT
ncbi:hypothetical protein BJ912DRAFT_1058806 [Pholiota molesta]|nr:hypothetical protein BJ912DRAFT_1058806 [Pholiota molesta]